MGNTALKVPSASEGQKAKKWLWSLPVMLRSNRDKPLRLMALNVDGMTSESKRRELVEKFKSYSLDVPETGETHILRQGVWIENQNECKSWEGLGRRSGMNRNE